MKLPPAKLPWGPIKLGTKILILAILTGYGTYHHYNPAVMADIDCSQVQGNRITLSLSDTGIKPSKLTPQLCDTLVIINTGTHPHHLVTGRSFNHSPYPEINGLPTLAPGETASLQLTRLGTYSLRDSLSKPLKGELKVTAEGQIEVYCAC